MTPILIKPKGTTSSDTDHTSDPPPLDASADHCPAALGLWPLIKVPSEHDLLYPWLLAWVLASSLQDLATTSGLGTDSTKAGWWFSPGCPDEALELLGHGSFNQDLVIISREALFVQQSQVPQHRHPEHAHAVEMDESVKRMYEPLVS